MFLFSAVCLKNVKIIVPEAVAVGDTVTLSCHYDLEAVSIMQCAEWVSCVIR